MLRSCTERPIARTRAGEFALERGQVSSPDRSSGVVPATAPGTDAEVTALGLGRCAVSLVPAPLITAVGAALGGVRAWYLCGFITLGAESGIF